MEVRQRCSVCFKRHGFLLTYVIYGLVMRRCLRCIPQVTCCMAMSVAATRYMIQDELLIQTTGCDTCIITTMIVLGTLHCVTLAPSKKLRRADLGGV